MQEGAGTRLLRERFERQLLAKSLQKNWPKETKRIFRKLSELAPNGIFATGIENSDPWIDGERRNQLKEAHDFERNFRARIDNIHQLGLRWLRFGVGYSQAHLATDEYDFSLTDRVLDYCESLGITVILDLLHFGLPEWLHHDCPETPFFQNPNFPAHFARYAGVVAERYPQLCYYTPVNEPFVTARLSAHEGYWNEKIVASPGNDQAFVRAAVNIARASVLARQAIETIWTKEKRADEPIFFQNESLEMTLGSSMRNPDEAIIAFNRARFVATDLMFGHADPSMNEYLKANLSSSDYQWFHKHGNTRRTVFGLDYYPWSINEISDNGERRHDPSLAEALQVLAVQYYHRYQLPMLHTEVNAPPEQALDICLRTYESLRSLREVGFPILGMSWFGDELQVGWQSALLGPTGRDEYRVGLYYKGKLEPVGSVFAKLAQTGFGPVNA